MCYERQASRTAVLSLLRTVHCDLEIVNYKLLTVTSASETWIHSQWIGDCAECSWSVTCVLLIEPFSFMHVFSISVLTFSEKRVWSTFRWWQSPNWKLLIMWIKFKSNASLLNWWGRCNLWTVQLHSCILQPFSDFIERRLWSLAFFLFGNACCIQLGELFAMNVELWTARFDRLNWLDLAHLLKIKPNAFVWS